jgi:hypothetical protein
MGPSFELPAILVPPEIAHVEDETSIAAPVMRHRELPIAWVHLFVIEVHFRTPFYSTFTDLLLPAQYQSNTRRRIPAALDVR